MPIYTYRCQDCGTDLEKRQGFNDEPLSVCESCGGRLRRTLHAPAIVFKGSGFYNTDYKNASVSPTNGDAKSDSKDGAKAEPSSDKSAPAAKESSSSSDSSGGTSAAPASTASKDTAKAV